MSYVKKDQMRVRLFIGSWDVECTFHHIPESRLTDTLNCKNSDFLAVTDATVTDMVTGRHLFETPFMNVNRMAVIALSPLGQSEFTPDDE